MISLARIQSKSTSSKFVFVKNLMPIMCAACLAYKMGYKTNKKKLMGDVCILKTFLDGKIPCVTANDTEQLNISISNSKKNLGVSSDKDKEIGKANEPIEQQKWF